MFEYSRLECAWALIYRLCHRICRKVLQNEKVSEILHLGIDSRVLGVLG